jgi:hypothetical protein
MPRYKSELKKLSISYSVICWEKSIYMYIEQSGTVLTFVYSQTLSLIQVLSVHLLGLSYKKIQFPIV